MITKNNIKSLPHIFKEPNLKRAIEAAFAEARIDTNDRLIELLMVLIEKNKK